MSVTVELEKQMPSPAVKSQADESLKPLARLIRYYILATTTRAGSGHPTSSLSATDLMTALLFGGVFRYDVAEHQHPNNDRLIFSKGHASPLFYALWAAAGQISETELLTYRQFGSRLEGHPTPALEFVEAATGSLGQGLSVGVGLACNGKFFDRLPYRTYVLLGDSEMAEGSQWEALELAAHYKLDNLVGVLDVNRLGQRGATMHGHDLEAYRRRISAFGWHTIVIDGHSFPEILAAYQQAAQTRGQPTMIIARTIKGKGVAEVEDRDGWHGKALSQEQFERALQDWGEIDMTVRGTIPKPDPLQPERPTPQTVAPPEYDRTKPVATRHAYGNALTRLYPQYPQIISLDGEVSNSTGAATFQEKHPERFLEMYIAEQNMAGVALGLSRRAKIPFVSTFAAFLTRAFDQIRMAQYSRANIKFVGSHAGVSIGEDGPSQMGLEDIAMFRTILDAVVLQPCDAISTERLVEQAARHVGLVYLRTLRQKTPILYEPTDLFSIGGSRVLRHSVDDVATVVATGATVPEALKAYDILKADGICIRVIDAYSIKPLDEATLQHAARQTGWLLTVEDHYAEGGLGEAVLSALSPLSVPVFTLAVRRKPKSGKPEELRGFEEISAPAIVAQIKDFHSVTPRSAP
ncbi:MAG TPA: transketolase [Dongiaceae bacterium]|nr:transketolase [Dongiaceae bacterium]